MKYICLVLLGSLFFSCKSINEATILRCEKLYPNNFSQIKYVETKLEINASHFSLQEMRFLCIISSISTGKIMYDNFGFWNKEIFPDQNGKVILVWEKVNLFKDGEEYTIMTGGYETVPLYASVRVLDREGNDLLSLNSSKKIKLETFFSNLIRKNDIYNKEFYKIYKSNFGN